MYLPIRLSKTRRAKSRNAQDHHGRWCHKFRFWRSEIGVCICSKKRTGWLTSSWDAMTPARRAWFECSTKLTNNLYTLHLLTVCWWCQQPSCWSAYRSAYYMYCIQTKPVNFGHGSNAVVLFALSPATGPTSLPAAFVAQGLTQPQRSWVFIPTFFGLAIAKLVNWTFQDRHHPQCRAFHASQVGVKPLKRWRIASRRPWSDVSRASQHAFLEMDLSHRRLMIQHRFPVTFTKAFYVPPSKPKVRSRGSIFPIAIKMEALCCALLKYHGEHEPKSWNLHLWVKEDR